MGCPKKKYIYIGFFFILFGLVMAMCDRWQTKLIIQGSPTRKKHPFNHTFLLWEFRMLMQFGLLYLWKAIDTNWCGFSIFRHGDREPPAKEGAGIQDLIEDDQNEGEPQPDNGDDVTDGDDQQGVDINRIRENDIEDDHGSLIINADGVRRRRLLFPPRPNIPRPLPKEEKNYTKLIYFPPAFFAVSHVLLVYFGIQLTYPSTFIMLKGTMPIFASIILVAFQARQLPLYIWVGVVLTTLGVGALGISDFIPKNNPSGYERYGIAAGALQILMGQIMFATKQVYEEKFVTKHSIHPMKFLGAEASYGLFFSSVLLLVFSFTGGVQINQMPNGKIEDIIDAGYQLASDWRVPVAFCGSLFSYIIFTYLGLFLVRDQGALARLMLELIVWIVYWGICILLGWEKFYSVSQAPGLALTLIGFLFFAHILVIPFLNYTCGKKNDEVIGPDDDEDVEMLHPGEEELDGDLDDQPLLQSF